jgi:hypothetical protein
MERRRVVDPGFDAAPAKGGAQAITILDLDDEQVVDVPALFIARRRRDRQAGEMLPIGVGKVAPARVPGIQMGELDSQDRSLDGVKPVVQGQRDVLVLDPLTVIAKLTHGAVHLARVGDQHAAIAEGAQILGGVEAESGAHPKRPGAPASKKRAMSLAGILDHMKLPLRGDLQDGIDVANTTEKVHWDDSPRSRSDGVVDRGWIDRAVIVAVDQHRTGAHRHDGAGRGNEGIRLGDDLVASTDLRSPQRQLQGRKSGIETDGMPDAAVIGELPLEALDLGAQDEIAAIDDARDCLGQGRLERGGLGGDVDEPDAGGGGRYRCRSR